MKLHEKILLAIWALIPVAIACELKFADHLVMEDFRMLNIWVGYTWLMGVVFLFGGLLGERHIPVYINSVIWIGTICIGIALADAFDISVIQDMSYMVLLSPLIALAGIILGVFQVLVSVKASRRGDERADTMKSMAVLLLILPSALFLGVLILEIL